MADTSTVHVWRGQAKAQWAPLPTLYRRLQNNLAGTPITEELVQRYETDILCESNGLGYYQGDRLSTLVALQHHGGATRFLDVTRNPLVALWFATDPAFSGSDGAVFHFALSPSRSYAHENIALLDDLTDPRRAGSVSLYFPPPKQERVKSQQAGLLSTVLAGTMSNSGPFSEPSEGFDVTRVVIPSAVKNYLRKYLERNAGLRGFSIYPDLVGYAASNAANEPFYREPEELYDGDYGLFPNYPNRG